MFLIYFRGNNEEFLLKIITSPLHALALSSHVAFFSLFLLVSGPALSIVDRHHIEGEKQNGGMKEKMKNSFFNLCFHFYARLALAFGLSPSREPILDCRKT
jgi:hypothetical protein